MGRTDFPISGIPEISGNVASLIPAQADRKIHNYPTTQKMSTKLITEHFIM